jgi:hypothetical protein
MLFPPIFEKSARFLEKAQSTLRFWKKHKVRNNDKAQIHIFYSLS